MSESATCPLLRTSSQTLLRQASFGKNRRQTKRELDRYTSFICAIICCLCAGSISSFSLYGHLFQERLNYTQTQVNTVALASQIAISLPVSLVGYLCDRIGPALVSFLSAVFFGAGYIIAAFTYKYGSTGGQKLAGTQDGSITFMVTAFILIGLATMFMYLSSITTCAKNFRYGKHRGLALSSPIAAMGLSGFWQSQVGSRIFYELSPDGTKGDVDVFNYFIFLALTLLAAGLAGSILLKVVDEDDLIDEAAERLERNGLLGSCQVSRENLSSYHSIGSAANNGGEESRHGLKVNTENSKKSKFLNFEASIFLKDPTMWWFAAGFLLVSGPGDAFISNLGTIIGTLNQSYADPAGRPTTAATHISIVSISSTTARFFFGTITDIIAPAPSSSVDNCLTNENPYSRSVRKGFRISRMTFLIVSALLLSCGQVFLAAGFAQNHADRFWVVSALIGFGYGAIFTLSPLIVSIVWGVENFGTNWGLISMSPAFCATSWDLIYSSVYESAVKVPSNADIEESETLCYGKACYSTTFWGMACTVWIGCAFLLWAWKGTRGWASKGVAL